MLEIEAQSADALGAVVAPEWAGPEITHEPQRRGGALSRLD